MESRSVTVQVCYGLSGGIRVRGPLPCDIVEGHRYADDAEPSWYSGRSRYDPDASGSHAIGNPYDSGIHERPSNAFRLPEQRPSVPASPYTSTPDVSATGTRIPIRGPEYPTVKPSTEVAAPAAEPTGLVPPVTERAERPSRAADSVYQTRRPVSSFIVAIVMGILMIPVVRLLIDATFAGEPTARAIVPAVLLTLGFALTGIGLFTIARGGPISREAWLRPPVAYLPAGLILLLAAGAAVA